MKKIKTLLIVTLILVGLLASTLYLIKAFVGKDRTDFLSTDSETSEFATGGEIDESTRTYDSFGSSGGYTPVELDVANCPDGRDAVYFGLGHTEFLIEGLKDSVCMFKYGTEVENPNWDGKLNTVCKVPANTAVSLTVNDQGVNFSPIRQYCSDTN